MKNNVFQEAVLRKDFSIKLPFIGELFPINKNIFFLKVYAKNDKIKLLFINVYQPRSTSFASIFSKIVSQTVGLTSPNLTILLKQPQIPNFDTQKKVLGPGNN